MIAERDALPEQVRAVGSDRAMRRVVESSAFNSAATILSYMSFGSEIDTRLLFDETLRRGKILLLPRMEQSVQTPCLTLHRVVSMADLVAGMWGINEPNAACPMVSLDDVEFALIPGVAFDRAGFRLGYGKGYYDRLLASRSARLAVSAAAFDCQVLDVLPVAAHDQRINALITPTHQYHFNP